MKTKTVINSENAGKVTEERSLPVLFTERTQAVISSCDCFAGVECTKDTVLSEVN